MHRSVIPPSSWLGTILKGTLNFSPATTWLEAIAWVAYLVPTMTLFLLKMRRTRGPAPAKSAAQPAKIS